MDPSKAARAALMLARPKRALGGSMPYSVTTVPGMPDMPSMLGGKPKMMGIVPGGMMTPRGGSSGHLSGIPGLNDGGGGSGDANGPGGGEGNGPGGGVGTSAGDAAASASAGVGPGASDSGVGTGTGDTYARGGRPKRADGGVVDDLPPENGLYSQAARIVAALPQAKASPQQFKATLLKQGVKPDEMKWSGYDEKLGAKPVVTKDEVAQHFKGGLPNVQETTLGEGRVLSVPEAYEAAKQGRKLYFVPHGREADVAGATNDRGQLLPWIANNPQAGVIREGDPDDMIQGRGAAPKFGQYTLPGGENYREVLLHLPPKTSAEGNSVAAFAKSMNEKYGFRWIREMSDDESRRYDHLIAAQDAQHHEPERDNYKSSHWDQPNVLAHLRMSDRKGPNGEKILHLEEMQSDWAQEGRQKGFARDPEDLKRATKERDDYVGALPPRVHAEMNRRLENARRAGTPADAVTAKQIAEELAQDPRAAARFLGETDKHNEMLNAAMPSRSLGAKLPRAPYVDSTAKWTDLGLKRALQEAARGGYDKLVVTPGEEQAKRYDLSKHLKQVIAMKSPSADATHPYYVEASDHNGQRVHSQHHTAEELPGVIGKELAERIVKDTDEAPDRHMAYNGLDLKVGGEGMKGYYDKILPTALQKLAKKHDPGAEVKLHGHAMTSTRAQEGASGTDVLNEMGMSEHEQDAYWRGLSSQERDEHFANYRDKKINTKLHSLDITPKMRASILRGHAAYATGGSVPPSDNGIVQKALQVVPDEHPVVQQAKQVLTQVPQQVPALAQQEKTASNASLARLLDKTRQTNVGRMVSRYQNPAPMTATTRLYSDLKGLTQEGEPGRMWYEKSSKRILDYVGGDKDEADKFAQLIAIYSPQTAVDVNTQNAIKSYNRAKAGQQLWKGEILDRDKSFDTIKAANDYAKSLGKGATKIPLDDSGKRFLFARHGDIKDYDNIATLDRDLKAHLVMNEGIPFEGRKINNFYNNLMTHIDPERRQGSTQDLWMARAFGFHDDAVGAATKYDFMEKLTHKLAVEQGWKPHQVQAAIWTAMKTRQEAVKGAVRKEAIETGLGSMTPGPTGKPQFTVTPGKEDDYSSLMRERALQTVLDPNHIKNSARDFSDFLDQNLAHVSWEATPSKQIGHLQGLEQKPPQVKADYHKRISEALQDEGGNDLLAKYIGMLSPGSVEAPGYWQGNVNPATHQLVGSTRIKAAGQRPDIDDASKELMNVYADARGLLLKQDGVGYHRPHFNPQVSKANGIEYKFDKELSGDEIRRLGETIDQHVPDTALIPVGPDTVRVVNFSGMADHKPYHKAVDGALAKADISATTAQRRVFASDGDLRGNDWKASPNGEDYRSRLGASRRPDVLRYISDVLAPKVEAVDEAFAKEHKLPRDGKLEKALRQLHAPEEVIDPIAVTERLQRARGGAIDELRKAAGGSVNHDPSEAQKSAGNYAKRKLSFQGIPISIENALGSVRHGTDRNGKAWSCKLPADYGYIRGTEGADGDHVDAYIGPSGGSNLVVVVNQQHLDGGFDEHKCLVGFDNEKAAIDCYCKAFSDGKGADRIKSVEVMSVPAFKNWLKTGRTTKPANARSIVDKALQLTAR